MRQEEQVSPNPREEGSLHFCISMRDTDSKYVFLLLAKANRDVGRRLLTVFALLNTNMDPRTSPSFCLKTEQMALIVSYVTTFNVGTLHFQDAAVFARKQNPQGFELREAKVSSVV